MDHKRSYEQQTVHNLASFISIEKKYIDDLAALASSDENSMRTLPPATNYLFKAYPELRKQIAYVHLGDLPTPIKPAKKLSQELGIPHIYIKYDGLSGKEIQGKRMFGGNKVRKLEFLLADALAHNARSVLTFGCTGSNHATATAIYAKSILMLKPQPTNSVVMRNLLLNFAAGARICLSPTNNLRELATVTECCNHKQTYDSFPYIIPTGGSCPLGVLGFVNAMLELKEQIKAGLITEPDRIYVPLGSTGTMVGMLIGAEIAELKSKIIGITVFPEEDGFSFATTIEKLFSETVDLLHGIDPSFPELSTLPDHEIIYDYAGPEYAVFTPKGVDAQTILKNLENIELDGVYTAKAFAGMLENLKQNPPSEAETILFWNTFYSEEITNNTDSDYLSLPTFLHSYFKTIA